MTDYKGLFANKPPVPAPKPAPVVIKPKTELKLWIDATGSAINEGRLAMHVGKIDPMVRDSVSTFGSYITDLVRQQVDAVEKLVAELQPVTDGFVSIKNDLNSLFEKISPPKKSILEKIFGEKEAAVIQPDEVRTRFSVIIGKTELYAKAALALRVKFERMEGDLPSIEKQFDELKIAGQYLITKVPDPDWVNRRLTSFGSASTLQNASTLQLKNGAETLYSYCDYFTDMKETLLPMWKTLCTEIALRRAAHETVDDNLQKSLSSAINNLKEKV
jgi:hypothetical protein